LRLIGSQIILTVAAEADNPEISKDYHLLRRMIDADENFIEITDLGEDLAMQVVRCDYKLKIYIWREFFVANIDPTLLACTRVCRMWMQKAARDLSNYQWRLVANAISKCSLPIFIKLVFAEICRWRSYTRPQETYLASTIMDSIMMLFERIEKQVEPFTYKFSNL
jgi:NACHT domain- and WD repeat-containing protein